MSKHNPEQPLRDLQVELEQVDHEDTESLRERLAHYLENLNESDDLRDDLLERLREFEIAIEKRQPGALRTLKAAIDTLANAGV